MKTFIEPNPNPNTVEGRLNHLEEIVDHLGHYLPAQGPIGVFVHHNTLHCFQHKPFEEAVLEAARLYDAEPYMEEEAFRRECRKGRILADDLDHELERSPNADILPGLLSRKQLRRLMLDPGLRSLEPNTLAWRMDEEGWLTQWRADLPLLAREALMASRAADLWDFIQTRMATLLPPLDPVGTVWSRPREAVHATMGVDLDEVVNPCLIRWCGAFLDQGVAYWPMPGREKGFYLAVRRLFRARDGWSSRGLDGLESIFKAQSERSLNAREAVMDHLEALGVEEADWEPFLRAELLSLKGWGGLMYKLEKEPWLFPHLQYPCTLMDFLAVRLSLCRAATRTALGSETGWKRLARPEDPLASLPDLRHLQLLDACQISGLGAETLSTLDEPALRLLMQEVLGFDEWKRREVFQQAYERRHARRILLPMVRHFQGARKADKTEKITAQVFFCIDDREESIRRHLEELDPTIETFGAAGFFGVAVDYTGLDDAKASPLCPVVVKPQHRVEERPVADHVERHQQRRALRRLWARLVREGDVSSKTLVRGWISTATLGFLSIVPLAGRVLSPLRYAKLMEWLNDSFLPEPRTELTFMRPDDSGREATGGLLQGFSIQEKVDRVASVLVPAGLTRGMARLVVILGHGSTSLNNPHESAYDCGACGGRRGGPNARLFAAMANHPAVRAGLREKGVLIPEDTWFLGGYHDTCTCAVEYFDLDHLPESHRGDFARIQARLDEARAMSAHERSRRFESMPQDADPRLALRHVQERAEHLGEPRPEYGHSSNAVCVVGRRSSTRGLFLDRRAFLVSYDATQDPEDRGLAAILGAVIPVCGGINLEYYFSYVDNEGYGCGTKLPHNISGLMGVMNGYESDLRTGLTWQMVEIHEPVRLLLVVESTEERVLKTIHASPALTEWLENRWVRLAVQDVGTGMASIYRNGRFEKVEGEDETLPEVESSLRWYSGKRDHLPVARIVGAA